MLLAFRKCIPRLQLTLGGLGSVMWVCGGHRLLFFREKDCFCFWIGLGLHLILEEYNSYPLVVSRRLWMSAGAVVAHSGVSVSVPLLLGSDGFVYWSA